MTEHHDARTGITPVPYWLDPANEYSRQYDAWYVKETGEWIEAACNDKSCRYCKDRPIRGTWRQT